MEDGRCCHRITLIMWNVRLIPYSLFHGSTMSNGVVESLSIFSPFHSPLTVAICLAVFIGAAFRLIHQATVTYLTHGVHSVKPFCPQ